MKLRRVPPPVRPADPVEPDPTQSPDLPYELAQQSLQRQLDAGEAVDAKITNAFTAATALLALLAAVLALRAPGFSGASLAWFVGASGLTAAIAVLAAIGTITRTWRTGPSAGQVIDQFRAGEDETTMRWKVVRNLIGSVAINATILTTKIGILKACYGGLALELVCVIGALAVAR
jgi:hypothetical protein